MARNVNVWLTNWRATGITVPVDQYTVDIKIQWTADDGGQREHVETVRFPNVLRDVPVAWLKDELVNLILRCVRKKLGIDP